MYNVCKEVKKVSCLDFSELYCRGPRVRSFGGGGELVSLLRALLYQKRLTSLEHVF